MSVSVRTVLFGDSDPVSSLGQSPAWQATVVGLDTALGAVSPAGRTVVQRELASAVTGLLNQDVGGVLMSGWRKHRALLAAAHATRADPSAREVVQLATHRVSTTHRPYVDVVVNGVTVTAVHFDVELALDVEAVVGTVHRARLIDIHSGQCVASANLACGGRTLITRQVTIDPRLAIRLGDGLPLLDS